ncbi:MAG: RecA-superfamily ATPase [Microbacterium sp.]|jgi:hypothetical protein|nr:RecA-superfamily ATPase [Microbacterium sp.]
MNRIPAEQRPQNTACAFAWCTTDHGETVHPDDEIHRSAGTGFPARVRDGHLGSADVLRDIEVGVIRRPDDAESWVALEFGAGYAVAIDVVAARTLGRLLRDASAVAAALGD